MPIWRRKMIPECPKCGNEAGESCHRNCPNGEGEVMIDILSGISVCQSCGEKNSVERWRHFCDCGAIYEGGEYWQGMAAEIAQIEDELEIQGIGIIKGKPLEIVGNWKDEDEDEEESGGGLCVISTAILKSLSKGNDCEELNLLRNFRDSYLLEQKEGRALIDRYYQVAPEIVRRIDSTPKRVLIYQNLYHQYLSKCINLIQSGNDEEAVQIYRNMVNVFKKNL